MPKVLLVEDDNNLREIFAMRLQAEGYQILTAGDGEEGLSVAMREKPDLIIADVMMPKLSGFEMLETLHAAPEMKNTKTIMMTALGQAEDQKRGEALGVVKYLVKSQATLEDFARTIKEVMPPDGGQAPAKEESSSQTNQESEKKMDEQTTPTNPVAPGADNTAPASEPSTTPASSPVESGAASSDPAGSGQMSTADESDSVQSQINDFVNDAPAAASSPSEPASGSPMPDQTFAPSTDSTADAGATTTDSPDIPVATPPPADTPATPPQTDAPAAPADNASGSSI